MTRSDGTHQFIDSAAKKGCEYITFMNIFIKVINIFQVNKLVLNDIYQGNMNIFIITS